MATSYSTGTVSITNGSTALVGVGSSWVVGGAQAGDVFECNGLTIEIATVNSATSITLTKVWPGTTVSALAYSIRFIPQATRVLTQTNSLLAQLNNGVLTGLSDVTSPAADKLPYMTGASSWSLVTFLSWARSFLGAASASAANTTLGLGTGSDVAFGNINSTPIGAATPAAGTFTVATVGSTATAGDVVLNIKGTATSRGVIMFGDADSVQPGHIRYDHSTNKMIFRTADVERFSIDGTGEVTIATGGLSVAGGINSSPIGATTPAAGTFTTLTTTGAITATTSMQINHAGVGAAAVPLLNFFGDGASTALGYVGFASASTNALWLTNYIAGADITFYTQTVGTVMILDGTTGAVDLPLGKIKFPATQLASADANTLDDYEEGSWTPAVAFGGASVGVTYSTQTGTYTKVGDTVHLKAQMTLSAKGSSTGAATITGLPFTSSGPSVGSSGYYAATSGLTSQPIYHIQSSGYAFDLYDFTATGASAIDDTNFTSTTSLFFDVTLKSL